MADNRIILQLSGSTAEKILDLSGVNVQVPREPLIATDTDEIFIGTTRGTKLIGHCKVGTANSLLPDVSGRFFFNTSTRELYVSDGLQWNLVTSNIISSNFILKLSNFTEGNILTVSSDGSISDSNYKFDDTSVSSDSIWSSLQILNELKKNTWILPVININTISPPQNPSEGDRYLLLDDSLSGAFENCQNYIVEYNDNSWTYIEPKTSMTLWSQSDEILLFFNGTEWKEFKSSSLDSFSAGIGIDVSSSDGSHIFSIKLSSNSSIYANTDNELDILIDNSSIIKNNNNELEVGSLDFGTF